jgi:hypothetical protein
LAPPCGPRQPRPTAPPLGRGWPRSRAPVHNLRIIQPKPRRDSKHDNTNEHDSQKVFVLYSHPTAQIDPMSGNTLVRYSLRRSNSRRTGVNAPMLRTRACSTARRKASLDSGQDPVQACDRCGKMGQCASGAQAGQWQPLRPPTRPRGAEDTRGEHRAAAGVPCRAIRLGCPAKGTLTDSPHLKNCGRAY